MSGYGARATRRTLEEDGAKLLLRLEIPILGPTTNQLRSGHWKESHAHRNRMRDAVKLALSSRSQPSTVAAPATGTD
jgi:hypothetical protein